MVVQALSALLNQYQFDKVDKGTLSRYLGMDAGEIDRFAAGELGHGPRVPDCGQNLFPAFLHHGG